MVTKGKGVDLFAAENIVAIFATKPNTNVTDAAVSVEINGATAGSYTLVSDDEGRAIRVRVSFAEDAGNHEELTSAATGTVEAAVVIPPLTATTRGVPSSHDGSAAFTFELRFREEPEPDFSYTTWRDPAFTVTGDQVTQARRLERPSNIQWEITVRPDSSGAVTVVLPVTGDCEADGAPSARRTAGGSPTGWRSWSTVPRGHLCQPRSGRLAEQVGVGSRHFGEAGIDRMAL